MEQKKILTVTLNPAVDKSSNAEHVVPEKKLRCGRPQYDPGGGGINVARAVAKLGGQATAIYLAGGLTGERLKNLLREEGIDHEPIEIKGTSRENLVVYENATGLQYRFGMPGPEIREKEWKACIDAIQKAGNPDFVVASGSLPPGVPVDFYAQVARTAKKAGAKVIIDTSGKALAAGVEEGVFLVKPNLNELKDLSHEEDIEDETHLEEIASEMARKIIESGKSEIVVISVGAAGAMMVDKKDSRRLRAPTVAIKSKVGAGDSMVAGMVLSLARGNSRISAVRFGLAAGGAAVMTPGSELCRREDTEALFEKIHADEGEKA